MKRLILPLLLFLLIAANINSTRSIGGVAGYVTYNTAIPMDSVLLYMGLDSTSWDLGRTKMTAIFSDDSKNWGYEPTLTDIGDLLVKIIYYPTGGESAFVAGTWYNDYAETDPALASAILDTLRNQDDWIAKEASLFDPTSDSTLIKNIMELAAEFADSTWRRNIPDDTTAGTGFDTRAADLLFQSGDTIHWANVEELVDLIWDEDTTGHKTDPQMGYWITQSSGPAPTVSQIADGVWDEDTTGHYNVGTYGYEATGGGAGSPWSTGQRDSVLAALADANISDKVWVDGSPATRLEINDILDTLQLHDTRWDSLLNALTVIAKIDSSQEWAVKRFSIRGPSAFPVGVFHVENTTAGGVATYYDGDLFGLNAVAQGNLGSGANYQGGANGSGATFTGFGTGADIGLAGTGHIEGYIDSVDNAGIGDNAITATAIAANAITAAKIATAAITAAKIATNAIGADEIALNAIGPSELAPDAIGPSELSSAGIDEIVDGVWSKLANAYTGSPGSFGDVLYDSLNLRLSEVSGGGGSDTVAIKAMFVNNWTSASSGLAWANMIADSVGTLSGCPSGALTMTYYSIDTSATPDDTLSGINIEIVDQHGNRYLYDDTKTGGYLPVSCDASDTFLVYVYALPGHGFMGEDDIGYDSIFIGSADTTIDLKLYQTQVGSPSGANTTRMYAYAYDSKGNPVIDAILTAYLNTYGEVVEDTCSDFIPIKLFTSTKSDSTGKVYLDLLQNDCISGADDYTFTLRSKSGQTGRFKVIMAVPSGVDSTLITGVE